VEEEEGSLCLVLPHAAGDHASPSPLFTSKESAACARVGDWDRALAAIDEAIAVTPVTTDRESFEEHRAHFRRHEPWLER
jgi:hypothetical protein